MRRLLRGAALAMWYGAAALLVVFAVVVSLGQYYFPYLGRHSDELLREFSGRLPFDAGISQLRAEWTGMAPTFFADDLRLRARDADGAEILRATSAEIRIDLLRSLFARAPRLRMMRASNVDVRLVQGEDGRWSLAGLQGRRAPANGDAIADFFLAVEEIDLEHARVTFEFAQGGQVETQDARLLLENYRRFRRLRFSTRDAGGSGGMQLLVESRGDPRQHRDFTAAAYLQLDNLELERWRPLLRGTPGVPLPAVNGRVWADMDARGVIDWQAELASPQVELGGLAPGRALQPLRELRLAAGGRLDEKAATLRLDRLDGNWYGQSIALQRLRATMPRPFAGRRFKLAAEYLDLGVLGDVVRQAGLLAGPWQEALEDLSPYGGLANVHFDLERPLDAKARFTLRARLLDVSASPWRHAPGIRNAGGYLEMGAAAGFVELDSGAITLEFPRIYDADLDFDRARGRVDWERNGEGVRVTGSTLQVLHRGARIAGQFDLRFRRDPALDDEIALAIGLRDGDASMRTEFVPRVLDAKLRAWLDASVRGGKVDGAAFAYHAVFTRPDRPGTSTVQLALDVSGAALDYHPDWPGITDASGNVVVDGRLTRAQVYDGRVLGSRVTDAVVEVARRDDGMRVQVRAGIDGEVADALRVVNESPITAFTGGALRDWKAAGHLGMRLDLDIPLGRPLTPATARIAVDAALDSARLDLVDRRLPFEDVRGTLHYSLAGGLRSEALDGTLWGRAVRATIGAAPGAAQAPGPLRIAVDGSAAAGRVAQWLELDPAGYLAGAASFRVTLEQRPGAGFVTTLESDLQGIESSLPRPLARIAGDAVPLRMTWYPEGEAVAATLVYGELVDAALQISPGGETRGTIRLGDHAITASDGLRIGGTLAIADIGAWADAIRRLLAANPGHGGSGLLRPVLDDLRIEDGQLVGASIGKVRLDARWDGPDFLLALDAVPLKGEFRLPANHDEPLALRLDYLQFKDFLPKAADAAAPAAATVAPAVTQPPAVAPAPPLDPLVRDAPWLRVRDTRIPPSRVTIADLRHGERAMGQWSFLIESRGDGLQLDDLRATLPGMTVGGPEKDSGGRLQLGWDGDAMRTAFAGRLRFDDIGTFFGSWGYDKVLESRTGSADLALAWPGNPTAFRMADATGMIDFAFKDGRLVQVSGNNPVMRALGLMSMDEILRRLKFDFKDFYQSGLGYDRFAGAIDIAGGVATTREPVEFKGPSARLRVNGQSDLRTGTIDADLVATLPIGSNLPWVAALAAGPAAAAGVYVASRLFESEIGKFSSAVYRMSGPLDDPKLELVKVFDLEEEAKKSGSATTAGQSPAAGEPAPSTGPAADAGPAAAAPATPATAGPSTETTPEGET